MFMRPYILLSFGTRTMNMWFNALLLLRWLPVMWGIFSALAGILLPSGICQVLPPLKLSWQAAHCTLHTARCGWIHPSRSLPCTGLALVLLSGLYDLFCAHCDRLCSLFVSSRGRLYLWRQNIGAESVSEAEIKSVNWPNNDILSATTLWFTF